MKDLLFDVDGIIFSYRISGVLFKDDSILLTKYKDKHTIPGGHVQIGESSKETIIREYKEETNLDVEILNVISTFENFYKKGDKNIHQLCVLYRLSLIDENQILVPNLENKDYEFVWVKLDELKNIKLYPEGIIDQILNNNVDDSHLIYK